jgi:hypothetical protein
MIGTDKSGAALANWAADLEEDGGKMLEGATSHRLNLGRMCILWLPRPDEPQVHHPNPRSVSPNLLEALIAMETIANRQWQGPAARTARQIAYIRQSSLVRNPISSNNNIHSTIQLSTLFTSSSTLT